MVTDNRGYQKQPPRPISIFPVSPFFRVNPSDQLQAGPQPKSFRGGQGAHNLFDGYKRDMAIWPPAAAHCEDVTEEAGAEEGLLSVKTDDE